MTFTPPDVQVRAANASVSYDASAFASYANASNPLQVSYPKYAEPISSWAVEALSKVGIMPQAGLSSGVLNGSAYWTYTADPKTGLRSSAETSFLYNAFGRPGLTVYPNALANNIVFSANKTATGVKVTSNTLNGQDYPFYLSARKEVILAAGVWHSPQILMLSGIGPADTLNQFSIPIVSALSGVGQDMHDTCNINGPVYRLRENVIDTTYTYQEPAKLAVASAQLLANGSGPLTNIGNDLVAWEKIPTHLRTNFTNTTRDALSVFPADWPELELELSTSPSGFAAGAGSSDVVSISNLLVATVSRGNMTIRSNSILDRPIITPNWLRDPADQQQAVSAYRRAREVWQALDPAIKPSNDSGLNNEIFPGANVTSDADLLAAVKQNIQAIHHSTASCKMGTDPSKGAVVDSHGKVFGVQGLRVIDSSTLPWTCPGHTQGVTYGLGEYMAQLVLNEWIDA